IGDVDLKKDATANGDVCSDGDVDLAQGASVPGITECQLGTLTIVPFALLSLSPSTLSAGGNGHRNSQERLSGTRPWRLLRT
ncbi:MAG: hypothetical protein MK125_12315, partial [Dehalococcoidia bacterium]|nr:hypothetical protein [Dehalococcoidia bacterium]